MKYHFGNIDGFRKFDLVLRIIKFDASCFLYGRVAIFSMALEETPTGRKLTYCLTHPQVAGCVPEGDWTVIGKYTASSSIVNATLVYKPFNLATPIAGLRVMIG